MWFIKSRRAQNDSDFETWIEGGVSPTLNVFDNSGDTRATVLIIDGTRVGDVRVYDDEIMQTVIQRWGTGGGNVPYVFPIQSTVIGRADTSGPQGKGYADDGEPMFTVDTVGSHAVATQSVVRRLTPTECELLQGFPSDWTAQRYDYKKQQVIDQADSSRYKQCGNAVAVPCVSWIVARLVAVNADD